MQQRQHWWSARIIAFCLGLACCEVILAAARVASPRIAYHLSPPWTRVAVADRVLGHRPSPFYPGHDAWGFRNPKVPDRCELLAIGDSMTYGYAASSHGSWPRQLEALSHKPTYNMSFGGYDPCHYHLLLGKGLTLRPRAVLLGLTIENDFGGAYKTVDVEGRCAAFRTRDEATLAEIREADRHGTLADLSRSLGFPAQDPVTSSMSVRQWISANSSLYALIRETYRLVGRDEYGSILRDAAADDSFEAAAARPSRLPFDADRQFRTVFFRPEYDMLGVDLNDSRIREGRRIVMSILASIQSQLKPRGIRFIVVLLPSKASAYLDIARCSPNGLPTAFFNLIGMQERLAIEVREFLQARQVTVIDTTPALRRSFNAGRNPYPESDNNHPNEVGYRAIAEAILPVVTATQGEFASGPQMARRGSSSQSPTAWDSR